MKPTIKDVAKKANVSIATVSRILNQLPGYTEETKRKVLEAIEELNYKPNALARGLIGKKTQTIGVLFPYVSSMLSSEILDGIENIAHDRDSSVIVCHTASNGERTMKYLQMLHEKRVDGLIFASSILTEAYYQRMVDMNVPVVLLSTASSHPFPFVKVDDEIAAYSATEYLIQKGHRHIAMVSGSSNDPIAGIPRIEGFKKALKDYQLPCHDHSIIHCNSFGFYDGQRVLPLLLDKYPEATAVFAASDDLAMGVISSAYQLGIAVPQQLSVIGYDNTRSAEMAIPPLTTVAQPLVGLGEAGASMLFEMIDTGESVPSKLMEHYIVERESVKKLE